VTVTRLLLDTHALVWWAADPKTLGRRIKRLIEDHDVSVYVSAASGWEIATKVRLGKLKRGEPRDRRVVLHCAGIRPVACHVRAR
jgi:PIN domain nuclease of toxin-antitoxin system